MSRSCVRSGMPGRELGRLFAILLVVAVTLATGAFAQKAKTAAEKSVLEQVNDRRGEATLSASGTVGNKIGHEFLEDLIASARPLPALKAHGLTLTGAVIDGPVTVSNVSVPFHVIFDQCQFPQGFDFSSTTFSGGFSLTHSTVGTDRASAPMLDVPTLASAKFAKGVTLDETSFLNGLDFSSAEIANALSAQKVVFTSLADEADFSDIKIGGAATFQDDTFRGNLDLTGAQLYQLTVTQSPASAAGISSDPPMDLLITDSSISKGLVLSNLSLSGFDASLANVQDHAQFNNVTPKGVTSFAESTFQKLYITGLNSWTSAKPLQLDGLNYSTIAFPGSNIKPPEKAWLDLIDQGTYKSQVYSELETFLRNSGGYDYADQVYFDMRRMQRKNLPPLRAFLDWMEWWLIGYGRDLRRAGWLVLLMVVVGAVLFRKKRMEPDDKDMTDKWYNPVWFSLDLLSPIDLGVASKWHARSNVLRNYAQVHRVAGWILIPLIVAAVTGIIK